MIKTLKFFIYVFVVSFIIVLPNKVKALEGVTEFNDGDDVSGYNVCEYDNLNFTMYFDNDFNWIGYKMSTNQVRFQNIEDSLSTLKNIWKEEHICPKLHALDQEYVSQSVYHYYYLFADSMALENSDEKQQICAGSKCIKKEVYCTNTNDKYCDPEKAKTSQTCITYHQVIDYIGDAYSNNKETEANKYIDTLSITCDSILKGYDYNEDCAKKCLRLNDDIIDLKKDDYNPGNVGNCNISQRIVNWFLNILKWVRYGVPILVIILGGIDFVKAIASDSDDELKKAGGRFVKRLIAAALIFLVPFLLEFILNVFGYDANNFCS